MSEKQFVVKNWSCQFCDAPCVSKNMYDNIDMHVTVFYQAIKDLINMYMQYQHKLSP